MTYAIRAAIIVSGVFCIALAPFSMALGWNEAQAGDVSAMLLVAGWLATLLGAALLLELVKR